MVPRRMPRKIALLLAATIWGLGSQALMVRSAWASTPLTRAVIQLLRNDVDLIPNGEPARDAAVSDRMIPGDALSTARESFAELRFNDGSLARVGERVLFRFIPDTRTFRLNNGTMLLLIPPGQGRSHLQTPNATAGIRGSALFARYIEETDTTLIGALTNSGIEVYNEDQTERYELKAGHVAVIVEDRIERVYKMDLGQFYATSNLAQGLNLGTEDYYANRGPISATDETESIALVRSETLTALEDYEFDDSAEIEHTPGFARMSATLDDLREAGLLSSDASQSPADGRSGAADQLDNILDASELQNTPIGDEPSFTEPVDREPGLGDRPEPNRPEPNRPEPNRPEPDRAEPNRPEPDRPEPNRPEPEPPELDNRPSPGNQLPGPDAPDPTDQVPPPDDFPAGDPPDRDDNIPDRDDNIPDRDDDIPDPDDDDDRGPLPNDDGGIISEPGDGDD